MPDTDAATAPLRSGRFAARMAKREIAVELTPAAKDFLADAGWDPRIRSAAPGH